MQFKGNYQHAVDAKGRVIMPAKLRASLGDAFVITYGLDENLYVFSNEEWNKFSAKLNSLPLANPKTRAFATWFNSSAEDYETDKQGRVLLAPHHRKHAALTKDVTIIGNGNRIEIWSTERWNQYVGKIDPQDLATGFDELGILI